MPERHAITLELTDRQVRCLRQAVYDYADQLYAGRMERLAMLRPTSHADTQPSPLETAAWELARRVEKATDQVPKTEVPNAMPAL
jgi:hypothetical protein